MDCMRPLEQNEFDTPALQHLSTVLTEFIEFLDMALCVDKFGGQAYTTMQVQSATCLYHMDSKKG